MTEQTTTRIYLGVPKDGGLVDVVHFTSWDDQCAPRGIQAAVEANPDGDVFVDGFGQVWERLTDGMVAELTADREGACLCEITAAMFGHRPVRASVASTPVHVRPLRRDSRFWATVAVTWLVAAVCVLLIISAVTA